MMIVASLCNVHINTFALTMAIRSMLSDWHQDLLSAVFSVHTHFWWGDSTTKSFSVVDPLRFTRGGRTSTDKSSTRRHIPWMIIVITNHNHHPATNGGDLYSPVSDLHPAWSNSRRHTSWRWVRVWKALLGVEWTLNDSTILLLLFLLRVNI